MEIALRIVSSVDWITWCMLAATLIIGFWPERGYVWRLIADSTATPDELPPVYTASNIRKGGRYHIKTNTGGIQHFGVVCVQRDGWFEVKVTDVGNMCQGWVTELPSNVFIHAAHLRQKPSLTAPPCTGVHRLRT